MELLTQELIKQFQEQGHTDGKDSDKVIIICKFFNPAGIGTWYAVEYIPEEKVFFGFVSLFGDWNDEMGYFSLDELQDYKGQLDLGIERDLHFGEHFLSEVLEGKRP
jgi:hypothetical protein